MILLDKIQVLALPIIWYFVFIDLSPSSDCRDFDVDVAFWGHVHQYERTCGIVVNGTCGAADEDGTVHGKSYVYAVLLFC